VAKHRYQKREWAYVDKHGDVIWKGVESLVTALQSPIDAAESMDEIEVPVSAQHRKRVLATESRNPNVIGRNRGSGSFEFTADDGIGGRSLLIYVQHPELRKVFDKPVFVALPLARLLDTISVFAQYDDGNSDLGRLSKDRFKARVTFC
jgi:hypothetical protein